MKKVIFLAIALAFANMTLAQTEQGKVVLSGATGLQFVSSFSKVEYGDSSDNDIENRSYSIMPSIGYFVKDNLALGIATNFSYNTVENGEYAYTTNSTMLMPNLVYYFPTKGQFRPLLQGGAGFMAITTKQDSGKFTMRGFAANIGAGLAFFMTDYVSLNFGLTYTMANLKEKDNFSVEQKQHNLAANIGLSIFL